MRLYMEEVPFEGKSVTMEHDVLKNVRVSALGGDFTRREVFYIVYCPQGSQRRCLLFLPELAMFD